MSKPLQGAARTAKAKRIWSDYRAGKLIGKSGYPAASETDALAIAMKNLREEKEHGDET